MIFEIKENQMKGEKHGLNAHTRQRGSLASQLLFEWDVFKLKISMSYRWPTSMAIMFDVFSAFGPHFTRRYWTIVWRNKFRNILSELVVSFYIYSQKPARKSEKNEKQMWPTSQDFLSLSLSDHKFVCSCIAKIWFIFSINKVQSIEPIDASQQKWINGSHLSYFTVNSKNALMNLWKYSTAIKYMRKNGTFSKQPAKTTSYGCLRGSNVFFVVVNCVVAVLRLD